LAKCEVEIPDVEKIQQGGYEEKVRRDDKAFSLDETIP
jgi:hypothetical protein